MTNKRIYIVGGLFFLYLFVIGLKNCNSLLNTKRYGRLITVTVTDVPNCFGTKIPHHFRFEYYDNGELKEYSKRVGSSFCLDLFVGKKIQLQADLQRKDFLFVDENIEIEFYATGILGLFGFIILISGLLKSKSTQHAA